MPEQTQDAVNWALQQSVETPWGADTVSNLYQTYPNILVDKVREYYNTNSIEYSTYSYNDLLPYLPE